MEEVESLAIVVVVGLSMRWSINYDGYNPPLELLSYMHAFSSCLASILYYLASIFGKQAYPTKGGFEEGTFRSREIS